VTPDGSTVAEPAPSCRERPGRLSRWLRSLAYFPALGSVFIAYELALRVWAVPCSQSRWDERARRFNVLIRSFGRSLARLTECLLDVRVVVHGAVPPGRFVVIANHQSAADIAFLIDRLEPLNVKFVAKAALRRFIPSVSTALTHGGAAFVTREGGRDDLRSLLTMARDLERWSGSALVFAEGTRARDGSVAPFHVAGVRVVARESGLPLLPVCIEGTHLAADVSTLARGLAGACVVVTIGQPVEAPADSRQLAEVLAGIQAWSERVIETLRDEGITARPVEADETEAA